MKNEKEILKLKIQELSAGQITIATLGIIGIMVYGLFGWYALVYTISGSLYKLIGLLVVLTFLTIFSQMIKKRITKVNNKKKAYYKRLGEIK